MDTPSVPARAEDQQKPGWVLTALFFGVTCAVLRLGEVWSWWALLWVPLLVLAIGSLVYEWRLMARSRWRMGPLDWGLLVTSHLGLAAALAAVWLAGR
ncbi:hypothetical protein ACS04_15085 [Streptomyces roseus]|uniref:Uncharacterized protein n=1 Tax=Streptomyces roseus TaxID=66430 RepID=A0A0J6XQI4_9ACTN|nr:hypothetical protein ACS04_15085 [Streptomyces roseus]